MRAVLRDSAVWMPLIGCLGSLAGADNPGQPATGCCVRVARDGRSFVLSPSGRPFVPWGLNYDHDERGVFWRITGTRSGAKLKRTSAR